MGKRPKKPGLTGAEGRHRRCPPGVWPGACCSRLAIEGSALLRVSPPASKDKPVLGREPLPEADEQRVGAMRENETVDEIIYEPPMLVEVGGFAHLTRGFGAESLDAIDWFTGFIG